MNLPTGSATFSLPMFNWQDDKSRLSSIVELDYNSGSGLKVSDVASNVGQGWNLISGGVISRQQVGEPDDQIARDGNGTIEDVTKYPSGFLYSAVSYNVHSGCPTSLTKYPIFPDKNHIYKQHNEVAEDKEADYFSFSFNGRTGMFALDRTQVTTSSTTCPCLSIGDSKLKIWCILSNMTSQQIRTTIDVVYIQDENGLIYKFATHDVTQVLKTQYCDAKLNAKYTQPKLKSGKVYFENSFPDPVNTVNPKIISSWYLTEISDPLTLRKITFTYTIPEIIHADAGNSISYYEQKNYSMISHSVSYTETPKIASITYEDGHQVIFNYSTYDRLDLAGDKILLSVDIKYQGRYISKYILNTRYVIKNRFGNPNVSERGLARLYLKSVKKIGPDLKGEDRPYSFDYWLGSSATGDFVPPPFFHIKDIWGYYNGDNNFEVNGTTRINLDQPLYSFSNVQLQGLCFIRDNIQGIIFNPKPSYAKNGLLRQITYPTGGSLNYDYAQNYTFNGTQNTITGGVHVIATTLTDGGYSNNCNNAIVTNYNYALDPGYTQSSLWGAETPLNTMTISNHYSPQIRKFRLTSLGCKFKYQYPGIQSRDQATSLTTGQQLLMIASTIASVAGTISEIIDVIQLAAGATGPAAVIIDVITTVINIGVTCFLNADKDNNMTIHYNSDLHSSNPLPTQFKKLQVVENSGANGKTVYDFTSDQDYSFWVAKDQNLSMSMKQRYPYWAYGLTKKITVYDAGGVNPIRQTENIYDPAYLKDTMWFKSRAIIECTKCLVTASTSQRSDDWASAKTPPVIHISQPSGYEQMLVDEYDIYTGRLPLQTTYERVFKPGSTSQYLETTTQYQYNSNFLVSNITTTQSNGDINYKAIDYYDPLLTPNKIIATPVETNTSYTKSGSSTIYYTGESITDYTTAANGNIVPSGTRVKRFTAPVLLAAFNSAPYKTTQTLQYDLVNTTIPNNNVIGIMDEGGHTVTNIYDYNDKYVTASVINANAVADKAAYTSFETTDLSRSGWTLNVAVVPNPATSVTGLSSLTLSSGKTLTAPLNTSKPYKVSVWSTASITVSPNATLVKSAPSINGFTYYEYNIAQGTSTITVSGSANIDELRLYPQNARMRTITYDPIIGKTSECDENNRITYYEYDDLGRLRFVKDENKSIVKMYEYNLKSKVTTCPATYHNLAVSEVFTKNNCAANYVGGNVAYTIPDSKYTSTISQEDVDQKVQAELDAMGQNYANSNGTCKQLFSSAAISQTFTKEDCPVGYKGTTITYSIPAGFFTSTVNQSDADTLAMDYVEANGQAFANLPGNASCVVDTAPYWEGDDTSPTQCQVVNGSNTGHRLVLLKDINPNSSSYNQTQWVDEGVDPSCQVSCTLSASSGFNIVTSSISSSGTTASFYIVFTSASGTANWTNSNQVATINGGCKPSSMQVISMTGNGCTWEVIITTTGAISVRVTSGTPPAGNTTIGLTGGVFNL